MTGPGEQRDGWSLWRLDAPAGVAGPGITLALASHSGAPPQMLHFGPALPHDADLAALAAATRLPVPPASLDQPIPASLMPPTGWGYWGHPAVQVGGDTPLMLRLVEGDQADHTLHLTLQTDPALSGGVDLRITQTLTLAADTGCLSSAVRVENRGAAPVDLLHLASLTLPLPGWMDEILGFTGEWCGEFQEQRQRLTQGALVRENRRGRTSHDSFPGLVLGEAGFDATRGTLIGLHLGWSGNHRLSVERLAAGGIVAQLAGGLGAGEIRLPPGAEYAAPTAYAVPSAEGLNGLMRRSQAHVRAHILPRRALRPRPVHLNTWEAVYFDHSEAALFDLVDAAAAVGVERFVLDDGWFPARRNDRAGLGDWRVDPTVYPRGLGPLIDRVQAAGMEFGLWVEPEMVNPDSDLYRAHPDWVLAAGAERPTARHQLVLNLTRPDVADYLFGALDRLLRDHPIAYLKWDMNRDLVPAHADGRPVTDAQTRAVYALIDRLRAAHPSVEIETCASGGGRADWGILARTERVWTSDSNDARDRMAIQRGFSLFFPAEVMGSHIGPPDCHVTRRHLPLATRGAVALFGHLGIEWDIRGLAVGEREQLAAILREYKRLRPLIHSGFGLRLPADDPRWMGWGCVAPDRRHALFAIAARDGGFRAASQRLTGLDPARLYRLRALFSDAADAAGWDGALLPGAALMSHGLSLRLPQPDHLVLIECECVS